MHGDVSILELRRLVIYSIRSSLECNELSSGGLPVITIHDYTEKGDNKSNIQLHLNPTFSVYWTFHKIQFILFKSNQQNWWFKYNIVIKEKVQKFEMSPPHSP